MAALDQQHTAAKAKVTATYAHLLRICLTPHVTALCWTYCLRKMHHTTAVLELFRAEVDRHVLVIRIWCKPLYMPDSNVGPKQ